MTSIVIAALTVGYRGKTVDFERYSPNHRTTVAHFLNHGKWDESLLDDAIKTKAIETIYNESIDSGQPIYTIVDDTICSATKPSSQAFHPIESAYFHRSHLRKGHEYGHQAVAVMLSCNGITLPYATVMYDKTKTKIDIVKDIADSLPMAPVASYFLCDSWYTSKKLIDAFLSKGFYCIGAIKTNRNIHPCQIKQKINEFASYIRQDDPDVHLVTVGSREYHVYRYEGSLNGIEDAVVLLTYPKGAFGNPKALRAFLCTDTSLSTEKILDIYAERWQIEVYFRQCKNALSFDKCQVRSAKGVKRFWLIMNLVYLMCCTSVSAEKFTDFSVGHAFLRDSLAKERIAFIYHCGVAGVPLNDVFHFVA